MQVMADRAVQMHYHLTTADGTTIDRSHGNDPLTYLHGHGHLVPGVEKALEGKSAGDQVTVVVPPEEGYGLSDPDLDVAIPLSVFPAESRGQLVQGARFSGPHPANQSESVMFVVMKVESDKVLCTANHPLADVTLHFDIEVVSVRQGTRGEIADGRIHAPDCSTGCC